MRTLGRCLANADLAELPMRPDWLRACLSRPRLAFARIDASPNYDYT